MGARILLVEDEIIIAEGLKAILARLGHQVVGSASNGREALTLGRSLGPDLVLMDIGLEGDMDGLETACRMQEASRVPIVYLTGHAGLFVSDPSKMAPPGVCVTKPFSVVQIKSAIEIALLDSANKPPAKDLPY